MPKEQSPGPKPSDANRKNETDAGVADRRTVAAVVKGQKPKNWDGSAIDPADFKSGTR